MFVRPLFGFCFGILSTTVDLFPRQYKLTLGWSGMTYL